MQRIDQHLIQDALVDLGDAYTYVANDKVVRISHLGLDNKFRKSISRVDGSYSLYEGTIMYRTIVHYTADELRSLNPWYAYLKKSRYLIVLRIMNPYSLRWPHPDYFSRSLYFGLCNGEDIVDFVDNWHVSYRLSGKQQSECVY